LTDERLSAEEQLAILMRSTRFADETDEWRDGLPSGQRLREQMRDELRVKLKLGRPLRVYLGVDPTSTDLHVGHFVPLLKLRRFQDLGHHVIFLVGDYTATIGDPSGQVSERKNFTHEQTLELARTYTEQAFRVLDPKKTEVRHNSEWLAKLSFAEIVELAAVFPMKQIIARRDFQKRMDRGESLRFHEALYALMQGYDAYALKCDVQVGAYDQYFNILAGRAIQQHFGDPPHVMITNPLIPGTDGRKMSKSYGNTINICASPFEMYGKTMRISDEYIAEYLEYASFLHANEIDELLGRLRSGINPMAIKKALAHNLVEQYHGRTAASEAEAMFRQVVQRKSAPSDMPEVLIPPHIGDRTWVDLCVGLGLSKSKSELRRLIQQGGFYVEQESVRDIEAVASVPADGVVIRLGKRRYYRLVAEGEHP
jgi:tyrosyl-tRNA synthetase